jgi:hypothetical protein
MMKDATGGPAYPSQEFNQSHCTSALSEGMTLLDYFAGQYLSSFTVVDGSETAGSIAEKCYRVADAMLKERNK